MRGAHLLVPIAVGLALLTASAARADITPLPKPEGPPKTVTPLSKPPTGTSQQPQKQPTTAQQPVHHDTAAKTTTGTTTGSTVGTTTGSTTGTTPPVPVLAVGGRVQPSLPPIVRTTRSKPGTSLPSKIALLPTRLAKVGHESLPNYDTWPSWVLGAFTLLASAEAFLLVRLARARRYRQEALQEVSDL